MTSPSLRFDVPCPEAELLRTPSRRSSQNLSSRYSGGAFPRVPHPPKPRHIGQTVHARGSAYATCYALQPFAAHRCKGRGFGIVYCCQGPSSMSVGSSLLKVLQEKREPTSGLEPLTPAPATSVRSVVAGRCRGLQFPHF